MLKTVVYVTATLSSLITRWIRTHGPSIQFTGLRNNCFSANSEKENWARKLGAHNFLNSHNPVALRFTKYSLDLVLVIVNAYLYWNAYLNMPMPRRKLHIVGQTPPVK